MTVWCGKSWWPVGAMAGALLLAGCTSATPPPVQAPLAAPPPPSLPRPPASASLPVPVRRVERPDVAASPAVVALMDEAQTARQTGNLEGAAAALERALRMQPRNALLWHRLAELRLQQEKPQMALDLALKSKLLAGSGHDLVQKNWALIATAKHLLGDETGATAAENQAVNQP